MKSVFIIGMCLLGLVLVSACSDDKDEDLTPSFADRDWYCLTDGDEPADHAFYELYRTFGVSVFYNDTIGREERGLSRQGDTIVHYEVIDIDYWITSRTSASVTYTLNKNYLENGNKSHLLEAAEFLREYVFTTLKKSKYPMSFLLVDSIVNDRTDPRALHAFNSYYAMTTTLIGGIDRLGEMSDSEKKLLAGYVLAELYVYDIKNNSAYMDLFTEFFERSVDNTGKSLYGALRGKSGNTVWQTAFVLPARDWLTYGFLRYNPTQMIYLLGSKVGNKIETNYDLSTMDSKLVGYTFPLREQDLYEYIARVLAGDDAAFESEYAAYPRILDKYKLMKRLLPAWLEQIE